ncbi:MAG: ATP-binding cassette domain-containing protein, partial [Oscillospiraceae bacterium]|nr:ATP-binding cassette domain-containing protein [Oscillospiraceae bacterium]
MSTIAIEHLTKDYGHGRGVFDVNIKIDKSECYGFLGPNGAGKTIVSIVLCKLVKVSCIS